MSGKITTALLIAGGFITLLVMSPVKPLNFLNMNDGGVAHADVVDPNCDSGCYIDAGCEGAGGTGCDSTG